MKFLATSSASGPKTKTNPTGWVQHLQEDAQAQR